MLARSRVFGLFGACALIFCGQRAHALPNGDPADTCTREDVPWVQVDFEGWTVSAKVRSRTLSDLKVSLKDVGISACFANASPRGAPLAVVRVAEAVEGRTGSAEEHVVVTVSVRDAVTAKNVSREIDLRRFPKGARELALAIAADELLRASWAEVSLTTQASEAIQKTAPAQARLAVRRVQRVEPPRRFELGARAAAAAYQGGQQQLGGDLLLDWELSRHFSFRWAFGYRGSAAERSALGTVSGSALGVEGSLAWWFWRRPFIDLGVALGAFGGRLTFSGRGNSATTGREYGAMFVFSRAELGSDFHVSSVVTVPLALSLGVPLQSATALGEGQPLTAMSGLETAATLGLKFSL
ncbi:MAG: hypothetical protein SFV15_01530 [Polyangiaceae bacterium]|nr:hypothetical protein [Polyangiaceae bacterium]